MPKRVVPPNIGLVILEAIREKQSLDVAYLSKESMEPGKRRLSPHSLVHDGTRWHVRAFCHLKNEFRDFVMARFIRVTTTNEPGVCADNDIVFNNILKLILIPNPKLSKSHKNVVEFEYGMENGRLELTCREASFFYILRKLGLSIENKYTDVVQVVLENHDELIQYMPT